MQNSKLKLTKYCAFIFLKPFFLPVRNPFPAYRHRSEGHPFWVRKEQD